MEMIENVKKNIFRKFWFKTILLVSVLFSSLSCADKAWKDNGDSCIKTSENPPLSRVINYTDYYLCERKLPPRIAPNPRTRFQKSKD